MAKKSNTVYVVAATSVHDTLKTFNVRTARRHAQQRANQLGHPVEISTTTRIAKGLPASESIKPGEAAKVIVIDEDNEDAPAVAEVPTRQFDITPVKLEASAARKATEVPTRPLAIAPAQVEAEEVPETETPAQDSGLGVMGNAQQLQLRNVGQRGRYIVEAIDDLPQLRTQQRSVANGWALARANKTGKSVGITTQPRINRGQDEIARVNPGDEAVSTIARAVGVQGRYIVEGIDDLPELRTQQRSVANRWAKARAEETGKSVGITTQPRVNKGQPEIDRINPEAVEVLSTSTEATE